MTNGSTKRLSVWLIGAGLLAVAAAGSAFAADAPEATSGSATVAQTASAPAKDEGWHFTMPVGYYGFSMDGTVGLRGVTRDVDLDSGDVSDKIDKAFGIGLDFGKGKWSGITSATYIKFENGDWSGTIPEVGYVKLEPSLEWTTVSGAVAYKAYVHNPGPKEFSIEPLGGMRYTQLKATLEATGDINREESSDVSWEDLFVGFRMIKSFTEHFGIILMADFGSAVAGNSESSSNISFTGGWRFPFEGWSMTAFGGYKWQNVQYDNDEDFTMNMDMDGPTVGVAFSW